MAKLGDYVRDEITGLTGVVLGRAEYLYEATACCVHSRRLDDNGNLRAWVWIQEDRLTVIEEQAVVGFKSIAGKPALRVTDGQ